jgi:hypothetical protein
MLPVTLIEFYSLNLRDENSRTERPEPSLWTVGRVRNLMRLRLEAFFAKK